MKHTIEFYLQQLVNNCELNTGDSVILKSISKQVARSIALTDKQYELVKSKLKEYENNFIELGLDQLDLALETLSMPLRSIDRSQTIIVEDNWIVIKFPFSKKTIAQLDTVSSKYRQFYQHTKGTHEHRFKLYEPLINDLVDLFKNKNFKIDSELLEFSKQIELIKNREFDYVPYVSDQGLKNLPELAIKQIQDEIGAFDETTKIKYWDRSIRYGYKKVAKVFKTSELSEHLANRTTQKVYLHPGKFDLADIAKAVKELERFPLLVTLSRKNEFSELASLFEIFNFVGPQQQIVLDRIEDSTDLNFALNKFIKEKNFNTWLDKDIKIAYIFKNNLPKVLIKGEWRPIAHLSLNGEREQTSVGHYISQYCDLSIIHDSQTSCWDDSMSRLLTQWV